MVLQHGNITNAGLESIHARRGWAQAGQQAGAGRIAERRLAMGVREERSPGGEAIDARRPRLRMAGKTPDPIIEVIHGDEEDVLRLIAL